MGLRTFWGCMAADAVRNMRAVPSCLAADRLGNKAGGVCVGRGGWVCSPGGGQRSAPSVTLRVTASGPVVQSSQSALPCHLLVSLHTCGSLTASPPGALRTRFPPVPTKEESLLGVGAAGESVEVQCREPVVSAQKKAHAVKSMGFGG